MARSSRPQATRDNRLAECSELRTFRVETIRWQRMKWMVVAENAAEAERRFEDGRAEGPIAVEDEGQQVVEVTRMR